MRNILKCLLYVFVIISSTTSFSQVMVNENFESIDMPQGWQSPRLPPFVITASESCDGRSVRGTLNVSSTNPELLYSSQKATGSDIIISFDYKLLEMSSSKATDEDFGRFDLQYSVDNKNWITYDSIVQSNHTPSINCIRKINTISGADVPNGSDFGWRIIGDYKQGNNFIYIDNFMAVEEVSCKQPINLSIGNVSFDEVEISWTEFNTPLATRWEVAYCPEGTNPSQPICFLQNIDTATSNPHTVRGLDDGTRYDFYVRSVCSSNDKSAWSGPIGVLTKALGSDCKAPLSILSLPYTHSSNTNIYGNIYNDSPGANCATSANYLEGSEVIYHYQVSGGDDILQIDISGNLNESVGAFVYTSCADIGSSCIAGAVTNSGESFSIEDFYVNNGENLYIVISTKGTNTSTEYKIDISGFDCNSWTVPKGEQVYEFYNQTLGDFSETRIGVNPSIEGSKLRWFEDAALTKEIIDLDNEQLINNSKYWVVQEVMGCTSPILEVSFEQFDCNTLSVINVKGDSEICDKGYTILEATAKSDNLIWYSDETGGKPLAAGRIFKTPVINNTTTFWVSEYFGGEGELKNQANPGPTEIKDYNDNEGLEFELTSSTALISADVYVTGDAGNLVIELADSKGNIQERTVSLPGGTKESPTKATIPLNFEINNPEDGPFILVKKSGPDLIGSANASFPYRLGTVGEIIGSTKTNTYYYFYNWTIISSIPICESERKKITAVVNETKPIAVEVEQRLTCVGNQAKLSVESDDTDYNYTWEWRDINGMTQRRQGSSLSVEMEQETKFTVYAENPNTGCTTQRDVLIELEGVNDLPVFVEDSTICTGEIIEVSIGSIKQSFESTSITDWTYVNNSIPAPGLNASAADWKKVSSPFRISDVKISSNDESHFMITSSDGLGPHSSVSTAMISPSLSFVGVKSAELIFYHFHRYSSLKSTRASVHISVDGGNSWSQLDTYSDEAGSSNDFEKVTIDLKEYLGNANVKIKFEYTGQWGWWWAIDNVSINQIYKNGSVLWSDDSQHGVLYVDDQALEPYSGQHRDKLYFKAEEPGIYKITPSITVSSCETVDNVINIEVNDADKPVGDTEQEFFVGSKVGDINITGNNLQYFILSDNGEYIRQSINADLINGETYYISQRLNDCESEYAEVQVSFACSQPKNLDISVEFSEGSLKARAVAFWDLPEHIKSVEGYQIIVKNEDEQIIVMEDVGVDRNYIIIEPLSLEEEFTLELYSICDRKSEVYSEIIIGEFNTKSLGLNDVKPIELIYYPNPTRGEFNIKGQTTIDRIEVYDTNGRTILEIDKVDNNHKIIDLSKYSSGAYFIRVEANGGNKVMQIIKK